ncbi:MAG: hypothetical protein KAH17_02010 [Bacteroidales bacterium]|nr:hypothetical protein [Bacteroidales bacterium]
MKIKYVFVLLAGALLMSSCAGKRELVTYWKPDLKPEDLKVSGYDFESKLRWTSSNDADYLYFDIECSDADIQRSILRGGLTVYLDTTARKREYVYFRYPVTRAGRPQGNRSQQGSNLQRGSRQAGSLTERSISPEMLEVLNMSPVYWQDGTVWSLEDPMSGSSAFMSGASMDSTNTLFLHVGVPLVILHPQGLEGLDRLSVGFSVQGRMRTPGMSGQRQGGQQMSGGRSGGGRGGSGGRGGGGGRGGSMGGVQGQGMGAAGPSSISFWFVTALARK